jgi:hypothetical protein
MISEFKRKQYVQKFIDQVEIYELFLPFMGKKLGESYLAKGWVISKKTFLKHIK